MPSTFTSASKTGSATDTRTSAWAARWKTTSGRRRTIRSTTSVERTSIWCTVRLWPAEARASARLASDPVDRSSTTSTVCPSARSRSTRVEPMNPAPPVTSMPHDQLPAGTRSPSMTVPEAVTAPAPITDTPWITQR